MPIIETNPFSQAPLLIKMRFNDTELAVGTAFFYQRQGDLYLITNWHNLSGLNPVTKKPISKHAGIPNNLLCYACLNQNHIKRQWLKLAIQEDELPLWFQHPELGSKIDIGVLPVVLDDTFRAIILNELPNTPLRLSVSNDVFVLGYPLGLMDHHGLPIWKRASIASEPNSSAPSFLIDTATRPGMSGSPVIMRYRGFYKNNPESSDVSGDDWFGEGDMFVGIYSGRLGASEIEAQLGIVWKANLIDEIIDGRVIAKI